MRSFLVDVAEGEFIPAGYGIAYKRWDRAIAVAAPVPFNFAIAWARRVWYLCKRGDPKAFRDEMARARQAGDDAGFAACAQSAIRQVEDAYERGMRAGVLLSRVLDTPEAPHG